MSSVKAKCWEDPKALLSEIKGFDPTEQEYFGFNVPDPLTGEWDQDGDWAWQSLLVDWWMGNIKPGSDDEELLKVWLAGDDREGFWSWWGGIDPRSRKFLILKARQLGITWLAVAVGVWYILFRPGSNVVCYSHGEDEAKLLVQRAWLMLMSLPEELRSHVTVIYPDKAELPSQRIVLRHPDGRLSTLKALPDTQKAGHGETITFCIMDEVARMTYARGIYTAVNPAVARGGILVMISTANGVSNLETGEGNFFHQLWFTRAAKGLQTIFLKWSLHPERDEAWYETEAMALPAMERNQQYPQNPDNAFILSGDLYFNPDSLSFYRGQPRRPIARGQFVQNLATKQWDFRAVAGGIIEIYSQPRPGGRYGISADTSTGRSQDYSVSHGLDLTSGEIVFKIRTKIDALALAVQLKCLGRWYNEAGFPAKIIPESTGMGEAIIQALRSNDSGLMSYSNIYMHERKAHVDRPISTSFGFPMTKGTRSTVLERLRHWIHMREFAFLASGDVDELSTFVYRESGTTPRAMDGCNDDSVMSLALALVLMDSFGDTHESTNPTKAAKWAKQIYQAPIAWKNAHTKPDNLPPLEDERNEDGSRKE